jgi:hypothetical protein
VFRFNSTTLSGAVSGFSLYKLFATNGTSLAFKAYASSADVTTDGAWWLTTTNNTYIPANSTLAQGTNVYINFVVKDNGAYDEDRILGSIRDPVVLGVPVSPASPASPAAPASPASPDSTSPGCMVNPSAEFTWEWMILPALALWVWHERRRGGS